VRYLQRQRITNDNQTEAKTPADATQQDVAQAIGAKAVAAATATVGDELSEDDLEAVAGGMGIRPVAVA